MMKGPMKGDIDTVLRDWEYNSEAVQTRVVRAKDGRDVIQLRLDLGVLQMETTGRPDGRRPEGYETYHAYLRHQARAAERAGKAFQLNVEQCREADREFMQFYQRRVCFLAMRDYVRAAADADHTLDFMDLVRDHAPNEEYKLAHERYRPFVLFHRAQALAAGYSEGGNAEKAIDVVQDCIDRMTAFYEEHDVAQEQLEEDPFLLQLKQMDESLRTAHGIGETLQEKLQGAIEREDYEGAARLRDELRQRQNPSDPGDVA